MTAAAQQSHEAASAAVQVLPSVTLVGSHIYGLSLPDWAAIAGIAFVVLQALYLVWKWRREWSKKP